MCRGKGKKKNSGIQLYCRDAVKRLKNSIALSSSNEMVFLTKFEELSELETSCSFCAC